MSVRLAEALEELDETAVAVGVGEYLAHGATPLEILSELQRGMQLVGDRYAAEEYYLSELVFAAEIFKQATGQLGPLLSSSTSETHGTIVLGTVLHDIHDFGKDIVGMVLQSNGFKVIDLGVNVPYEAFVEAIRVNESQLVGLSCLLTTVFEDMKATVRAIEDAGLRDQVKILVGGGPVDQAVADYAGADLYCADAQAAVEAARRLVGAS